MDKPVIAEIARLRCLSVAELRDEWFRLYGEPTRSRNRDYLWKRLAWRVQELRSGGLSDAARTRIDELAPGGFTRARTPTWDASGVDTRPEPANRPRRDPRLPSPGSILVREYRGRQLRLSVLDDGFEFDGVRYGSLSAAARAVTGSRWNGHLFWGLKTRKR